MHGPGNETSLVIVAASWTADSLIPKWTGYETSLVLVAAGRLIVSYPSGLGARLVQSLWQLDG